MNETARHANPNELNEIYAKLTAQDIEQFYAGYLWWKLHQRAVTLQEQRAALQREIAANAELMEMVHPPAIALATMARLQASGVSDIDLLEHMLEQGEVWLDRTMQRLDYCEQLDFIIEDYTQWCRNALEGAYDWIDSLREGGTASSNEVPTNDTAATNATEELLLQKLTSEEEAMPESQEEQAVPLLQPVETSPVSDSPTEGSPAQENVLPEPQEEQETQMAQPVKISHTFNSPDEETITQENIAPESQPVEINHASNTEEPLPNRRYPPEKKPGIDRREHAEWSIPAVTLGRRHNFLQRLVAKIWRR